MAVHTHSRVVCRKQAGGQQLGSGMASSISAQPRMRPLVVTSSAGSQCRGSILSSTEIWILGGFWHVFQTDLAVIALTWTLVRFGTDLPATLSGLSEFLAWTYGVLVGTF